MALGDVLQFIVPLECLSPLQTLSVACSSETRRNTLRRNQLRRAIKSYITSKQRFTARVIDRYHQELQEFEKEGRTQPHWNEWQNHQRFFLQSLMCPDDIVVECRTWKAGETSTGLLTWCLDCESRSHACLSCFPPHSLTEDTACTNLSNLRTTQPEGHATVAVLFDIMPLARVAYEASRWHFTYEDPAVLSAAYQSLGCEPGELDLTSKAALSVLKEWYAKNLIEPDSLPGDDLRPMALPEELDLAVLSMDDRLTDETSTPH